MEFKEITEDTTLEKGYLIRKRPTGDFYKIVKYAGQGSYQIILTKMHDLATSGAVVTVTIFDLVTNYDLAVEVINLTPIEKAAYHEAGHAVMHILLNLYFDQVAISPIPEILEGLSDEAKVTVTNKQADPFYLEFKEKQIVILFAGCKAVQIKTNNDDDWTAFEDADHFGVSDNDHIMDLLDRLNNSILSFGTYKRMKYLRFASELLRGRWPKVEAVAAALLERKTLQYEEVRALVI